MATSNFYQSGNHGLNVINIDYEQAFEDTLSNIVNDINSKGYSVDHIYINSTPRSFETGQVFAIFTPKNKVVAILEFCAGYYEGANVNIYTDEQLLDEYEREEVTYNKRDIKKVVDIVKQHTDEYRKSYQFSNGETGYERV